MQSLYLFIQVESQLSMTSVQVYLQWTTRAFFSENFWKTYESMSCLLDYCNPFTKYNLIPSRFILTHATWTNFSLAFRSICPTACSGMWWRNWGVSTEIELASISCTPLVYQGWVAKLVIKSIVFEFLTLKMFALGQISSNCHVKSCLAAFWVTSIY